MNIAIDVRPLLYTRTGIGYSISQILKIFLEYHRDHEYLLYGAKRLGRNLVKQCRQTGTSVLDNIRPVPFPFRKLSRYYLEMTSSIALQRAGVKVFWGPNYRGVFSKGFDTVITIHDMAHIHYPDFAERHGYNFLSMELKGHARKAKLIFADSISTRDDIVTYLDIPTSKIKVIYLGVDSKFSPIHDELVKKRIRTKYGLPDEFILFVGTLQPRKNIDGLVKAFWILKDKKLLSHKLVLVGCKGWQYSEVFRHIDAYGLNDKVKWVGYVDYEDLPAIYSLADVFVLPSHYEGFGLPILEAMACGTPVITSNVSSMPEVAGDAAVLIDPKDPEMIAEKIYQVIQDSELRKILREKGLIRAKSFSWERCAEETMAAFEEVVKGRK